MKRLLILVLCLVAQAQAASIAEVLFAAEEAIEQTSPAGARDCKSCSKPKCGGCTRR